MESGAENKITEAKDTLLALMELSNLLRTGLDAEELLICVRLIEAGVDGEVLAGIVKQIRTEIAKIDKENKKPA